MGDTKNKKISEEVYEFLEKSLSYNSENCSLKELTTFLKQGTEIRYCPKTPRIAEFMNVKMQAIDHLNRLIDIKNSKNRFIVNLIVGVFGVILGAAVSILTSLIKNPPPC